MSQPREHWIAAAYDAHGPAMFRHALLILADRALAEDAVQQAFTKLLARGRMSDVQAQEAFLRVVVRNEAYRLLARRRPVDPLAAAPPVLLESADESAQRREEHDRLQKALPRLAPEQREVIHLKFYEQCTFAQIGQWMHTSPNTAASRYRYALDRLRELLQEPMPTPASGDIPPRGEPS